MSTRALYLNNYEKVNRMLKKTNKSFSIGLALITAPLLSNCVNDDVDQSSKPQKINSSVSVAHQSDRPYNPSQFTLMKGDFDGNGKKDMFYMSYDGSITVRLSNGSNYNTVLNLAAAGTYAPSYAFGQYLIGDINGDGKSDVFYIGEEGDFYVRNSNGTSLGAKRQLLNAGSFGNWSSGGRYIPGDFNGDGKTDILFVSREGRGTVRISDGVNYWTIRELFAAGEYGNLNGAGNYLFADFDGDLKSDIFFITKEGEVNVRRSTGTSLMSNKTLLNAWSFGSYWDRGQYHMTDINGDRKADLLFIGRDSDVHIRISNGSDYYNYRRLLYAGAYGTFVLGQYYIGDFDGDLKTDLFFIGNYGDIHVRISDGVYYNNYKQLTTRDPNPDPVGLAGIYQ